MGRNRLAAPALLLTLVTTLVTQSGCWVTTRENRRLVYSPEEFNSALIARIPDIPPALAHAPFLLDESIIERARIHILKAPRGPERVQALVDFLAEPAPQGLGLTYDWRATGNAAATLAHGSGNCVALASVLIALGRGMDWPIYYAEARRKRPETREFQDLTALSDHMAVVLAARSFQMIIDFTGLLDEVEDLRPIDDLTAYAHIINNMSAQRVMTSDVAPTRAQWEIAEKGFRLATRIQPGLGRSWNNLGIALTRLERFEEARFAYERAVSLDTAFGSASRNLVVMETRAAGETSIQQSPLPE